MVGDFTTRWRGKVDNHAGWASAAPFHGNRDIRHALTPRIRRKSEREKATVQSEPRNAARC